MTDTTATPGTDTTEADQPDQNQSLVVVIANTREELVLGDRLTRSA